GGYPLALHPPPPAPPPRTAGAPADEAVVTVTEHVSTRDVFAPGSVEEDHLRRHSSYLSDGFGQWMIALGVALRGLLCSLGVIGLTVFTFGVAMGRFYGITHIASLEGLQPRFVVPDQPGPPGFPRPLTGVTIALAVVAGLALLAYLLPMVWGSVYDGAHEARDHFERLIRNIAIGLTGAALLLALIALALPGLVWLSAWVTWHTGWRTTKKTTGTGAGLALGLSYFGSLAATLWRNKAKIRKGIPKGAGQTLPYSMVQMLLLWVSLVVLTLSLLLASGWIAASRASHKWWALLPIGALVLVAWLVDQTSFSLHPFYKRRLASAFAVRRASVDGQPVAKAYAESELTPLSSYAKRVDGFPQVIFATTGNMTGQDRTPPGRRAVSYTLASDYVGGPEVGWIPTAGLETLASLRVRRDLTVEAAVAISGAAFASAMGSQTRFYELFLALTNARLGAWLPNPEFVWVAHANSAKWTFPGLPDRRRLIYYAREIFGLHADTSRMLLCSDGGHYENLGLVELLRHRCRIIYCIDASGDSPPLATTLAQAITLAREELGVEITLTDPLDLVPGGADAYDEKSPLASLNPRMSKSVVCRGVIHYPAGDGVEASDGTLVMVKAALTTEVPYQLLSYAVRDTAFPRDSTSDQWFNAEMFDAYQGLGRYLGEQALAP
ncbi:MAG: hypothetical protein ACYDD7_18795, partial [Acidimicrobiales bacterium]